MVNNFNVQQSSVKGKEQISLQNRHQLLINSLIFAGLGFIFVGLLSIGYSYLIRDNFSSLLFGNSYYTITSSIILVVASIAIFIINWIWSRNILNASWGLIALAWIINIFLLTGMIAPLVTLINDAQFVFIVIAVCGGIFALVGGLSYLLMKWKTQLVLTKLMLMIIGMVFVLGLVFSLTFGFFYTNTFSVYFLVFDICYLVVSIIMIAIVFYSIKASSEVFQIIKKSQQIKLSLYFGMSLLISFVILFKYLLTIISLFKRN